MAFFCQFKDPKSAIGEECGARIVAPGHCISCKGSVPDHDGTPNACAAESAAEREMAKHRDARGEVKMLPDIERACLSAALAALAKSRKSDGDGEAKAAPRNESKQAGKPAVQ
jgi:hypothetical protein